MIVQNRTRDTARFRRRSAGARVELLEHRRLLTVTKLTPLTPELGEFAASGNYLYYATPSTSGEELWRTDGTVNGTLRVKLGPTALQMLHPAGIKNNGSIFFTSNQGFDGSQLWVTNGTVAGTSMLKVLEPSGPYTVQSAVSTGNLAYFNIFSIDAAGGLYVSDGTAAGTTHLPGGNLATSLANFNGKLLFDGASMTSPSTLWKSDGTANGTVPVAPAGVAGSHPRDITTVGKLAYYFATPPNRGDGLYVTDGTAGGTKMLYRWGTPFTQAMAMTVSGSRIFFVAQSVATFQSPNLVIWSSDGTINGTKELTNVIPLETFGQNLTDVNGTLYFEASHTLYKVPPGSNSAAQVVPTSTFAAGGVSASYRGHFYGTTIGFETLWISDGTPGGTHVVSDTSSMLIAPDNTLFNFGDALYFCADLQNHGLYRLYEPPPVPPPTGSISGAVFNDKNTNAKLDAGEPGIAGRKVFIDKNKNGKLDAGEVTATTAANGSFAFTKLAAGSYRIVESVPAGWRQTLPTSHFYDVALAAGQAVANRNFGDTQTAIISGAVFNDANGNAKRDASETGLASWTVYLDANNNGRLDAGEKTAATDSAGNFSFTLAAGSYTVRAVSKTGYTNTSPVGGAYKLTLAAGATSAGLLFGRKHV